MTALKIATSEEPKSLLGLTLSKSSPLKRESEGTTNIIKDLSNPSGKDGFLATNSLVAFFAILNRIYGNVNQDKISIPAIFLKSLRAL
ncbi:hypothetical protein [Niabella hibiscisoli]|uniref:hypothetical protein n=1 Tax=Niabella hibiscisoli TaxID=1825928 RepID=UPI001F0E2978|nr:hypothetical protein [Niabella hibiscisoli]MCH5717779.1 hypothetical protein [Niabella hibiscisoli]